MAQTPYTLAEPFSRIFTDRAEAEWAFDLLRDTAKRLGIHGAYDPRFALTLARRSGGMGLHLNFGGWLVLGFHGGASSAMHLQGASHLNLRVDLALLAERVAWDERYNAFPFERKEGEPELRSYHLPLEVIHPMTADLAAAYEATLDFIAHKFQSWKRAIHWQRHNPEIAEALFNPEQRERVLSGLLNEPELRYERHLTAFYQDISEEREEYEVGEAGSGRMEGWRGGGVEAESGRMKGWKDGGMEGAEGVMDFGKISLDSSLQRRSDVNSEIRKPLSSTSYFTPKTFDLLAGLHGSPTKDFYISHKDEFKTYVEEPFQQLFQQVASQLPPEITDLMETKKKIFARILKNDYGQGGTWDFYWGAFYTKGGKRTENAQLFIGIFHDCLRFGFNIGIYGNNERERFLTNIQANYEKLLSILRRDLANNNIIYGNRSDDLSHQSNLSFEEWLNSSKNADIRAEVVLRREEVFSLSADQLINKIAQTFIKFFPLVLLAVKDDPFPAVITYLNLSDTKEKKGEIIDAPIPSSFIPHPSSLPYPLSQLAANTGLDEAELARWVRAIERKGQAILYGPPGTGKTFVAEKLAQHLIGGGDGFWELVQFHPAYAYEDFIQGIRPESQDGLLTYPLVPGRFLEFCAKAATRQDACVLIIDEINRANLSRVFGELMYLLEYRDKSIPLAGGGEFKIPANVRLLGTMNTADRSIALVDHALRRRFAFIALYPNYDLLHRYHERHSTNFPVEELIAVLKNLNRTIGDRHYEVGVTFFLRPNLAAEIEDIWRMEIEPYLEEYFFDRPEKLESFRWEKVEGKIRGNS